MNKIIPIQGKLTDSGGMPLNGTYDITATIYSAPSGGTVRCTYTSSVTVTNGLFNMGMGNCNSDIFGGTVQLYLGIQVGSDPEMTPRQPIHGVPLSFGLVDGKLSSGATTTLWVPGSAVVKASTADATTWDLFGGKASIKSGGGNQYRVVILPTTIPNFLYGQPISVSAVTVFYKTNFASITRTFLGKARVGSNGNDPLALDNTEHGSVTDGA